MYRRALLRSSPLALLAPGLLLSACGGSDDPAPAPPPAGAVHLLSTTPSNDDPLVTKAAGLIADDMGGAWLVAVRATTPNCSVGVSESSAPDLVLSRVDLASGQWSVPTVLQTGATSDPLLVRGAAGAMLLVYGESDAAGSRRVWRRFDPGAAAWSAAQPLPDVASAGAGSMELRSMPNGDALLGWTEPSGESWAYTARTMRFDAGRQAWAGAQTVGTDASWSFPGGAGLVVDPRGRAVWLSYGTQRTAWHNAPGDDTWHPVVLPQPGAGRFSSGARGIGMDDQGNALVVWVESDAVNATTTPRVTGQLMTARCAAGTRNWTVRAVPLEQFQEDTLVVYLEVDGAGNAWVYGALRGRVYRYDAATDAWQRFNLSDIAPAAQAGTGYPIQLDRQGNAYITGGDLITSGEAPRVWWNRYSTAEGRWQGVADVVVDAPEVGDPPFAESAFRQVSPWIGADADGRAAMVIAESIPGGGFRCSGDNAVRLWGTVLRRPFLTPFKPRSASGR